MKKTIIALTIALTAFSCTQTPQDDARLTAARDSIATLSQHRDTLEAKIKNLEEQIRKLQYTASDRLAKINELIEQELYPKARLEIADLRNTFPKAKETALLAEIETRLDDIEAKAKAEQERIKALGFKAITPKTTLTIGYNKITLSSFSTGTRFIFDSYDDSWHYFEADRDCSYLTAAMSITSTDKSPDIPEFALYSINGDKMTFVATFQTRYARWADYGAYLGNYSDTNNNFAKVSTVRFKIGCQAEKTVLAKPYAIVVMNKNVLSEAYERFNNPPQYWVGSASYPPTLTLKNFTDGQYTIIKTANL